MKKENKEKVVIIPKPPTATEEEATPVIAPRSMPLPPMPAAPAPSESPETPVCQESPEPGKLPRPKPIKDLKKRPVNKCGLKGKPIKK